MLTFRSLLSTRIRDIALRGGETQRRALSCNHSDMMKRIHKIYPRMEFQRIRYTTNTVNNLRANTSQ